jgi:uncharacterized protein YpmS
MKIIYVKDEGLTMTLVSSIKNINRLITTEMQDSVIVSIDDSDKVYIDDRGVLHIPVTIDSNILLSVIHLLIDFLDTMSKTGDVERSTKEFYDTLVSFFGGKSS